MTKSASCPQERWNALKLTRRQKAIALVVVLWVLWLNVNWAIRSQALLLGALIVRCNLKPAEVPLYVYAQARCPLF
jgi:hypothetical protein